MKKKTVLKFWHFLVFIFVFDNHQNVLLAQLEAIFPYIFHQSISANSQHMCCSELEVSCRTGVTGDSDHKF